MTGLKLQALETFSRISLSPFLGLSPSLFLSLSLSLPLTLSRRHNNRIPFPVEPVGSLSCSDIYSGVEVEEWLFNL